MADSGHPELLCSTVAILFLFGNNCPNIDKLGSKCLFRKVQQNCTISF
jgi:hypothetical protein